MKRLFLLILIILHVLSIHAQYFCYTSSDYENRLGRRESSSRLYEGPYYMRVYFHIIRKTDGTGPYSFSANNISSCMQILNHDFNPHNIYFTNVGMDYINNTDFYNMESTDSPYNKTGNKYLPILENTSWTTISYYLEPPTMASVYTNIGDTLIGEKKHTIIKQYVINVNDATVYPDVNPTVTTVYLYEDTESKRVYQYDESHKRDVLMYDFSVQIGDKMPIDPIRHMTSDTLFVLKDISDIENSGYTRKQFTFVYGESDSIIWVEGIGNYTNFTIPYAIKHSEISKILCVQKDNNTVYDTGTFKGKTCEDIKEIFDDNYSAIPETKYVNPPTATKILRDGHILIIRDNRTYTLIGQPVE